jgi:hypothetical protein
VHTAETTRGTEDLSVLKFVMGDRRNPFPEVVNPSALPANRSWGFLCGRLWRFGSLKRAERPFTCSERHDAMQGNVLLENRKTNCVDLPRQCDNAKTRNTRNTVTRNSLYLY